MKRTFLVKKDPTIEAQDNWLIMDYRQYAAWRETDEGKNRESLRLVVKTTLSFSWSAKKKSAKS